MNHSPSTDAELVAATLKGNREAFGTLVERHQQVVCALAYAKTGSMAVSEDLAQETFLSAWKNLAKLKAPENFRGWLCGTVRNLSAKFHRGNQTSELLTEAVADQSPAPSEAAMSREEEAMLWATLEQLPETHREPLILFHRAGQSVREIAETLEISEEAVRQRLSRGRAMLEEAVRGKVEKALGHSRPGAAFTITVLASIPVLTGTAHAAGTGLAVAKASGTVAGAVLVGPITGVLAGVAGALIGMKSALDGAESARERKHVVGMTIWTVGAVITFTGSLLALLVFGKGVLSSQPTLWVGLLVFIVLSYTGSMMYFSISRGRAQMRIRAEERVRRGEPAAEPIGSGFEYRSKASFLGLPLIHVTTGGCGPKVAKGWIACGNVAIAPLFAFGGVAIGGIAFGGLSLGLVTLAGAGLGVISFSGLSAGVVAIGGAALGWIAVGGVAWGKLAAMGGQAFAGLYGLGRHVSAPHANDAVAKAFFQDYGILPAMSWLTSHGVWIQIVVIVPVLLTVFVLKKRAREGKDRFKQP